MNLFPKQNAALFSIFFSPRDMLWHKWDYEIDKYDILGNKEEPVNVVMDKTKNSLEEESADHGELSPTSGGHM